MSSDSSVPPFLWNHRTAPLSQRDRQMIRFIPPGGNWTNIPQDFPSERLKQIRRMTKERGGVVRTTYYGRLSWDKPSYTISTYFSRVGNGCFIHPSQPRLISLREGARLQSFPDAFRFLGSRTSQYKQIGNAVPPLLAYSLGKTLRKGSGVALFAGAGGMSLGFHWAGISAVVANEIDKNAIASYSANFPTTEIVTGSIAEPQVKERVLMAARNHGDIAVVYGGPPCQGFSMAGWHRVDDPRNRLFEEFVEVIEELRPRHFVMENVQGLTWMHEGKVFRQVMDRFAQTGYHLSSFTLKAEEFGVPQRRRRVFIVGGINKVVHPPSPLLGEGALTLGPVFTVKDAIGDLPPLGVGEGVEEAPYPSSTYASDYQRWARGLLPPDKLLGSRTPAWRTHDSKQSDSREIRSAS